jgi:ribosomal 50S subunit-recycling heat shock protein
LDGGKQRIDKWLFFARAVKSRSLGAKLASGGNVKINERTSDGADNPVRIGDVLSIRLERQFLVWKVLAFGERRGPAPEAQLLYEDLTPAKTAVESGVKDAQREPGSGRPEKKERRAMERLRSDIFDS